MKRDILKPYQRAEQFVADGLQQSGWKILRHNYRKIGCELDIIACNQEKLIIVEVKYRPRIYQQINLEELLPRRKRACLEKCARHFIASSKHNWTTIRFDLAVVSDHSVQKRKEPVFPPALDHSLYHINYFTNVFEASSSP